MIYVDPLRVVTPHSQWRYPEACHMIADTAEELDAFASRIGLRRSWRQASDPPHYDLTRKRREKALKAGAIDCDHRRFREEWRRLTAHRRTGHAP